MIENVRRSLDQDQVIHIWEFPDGWDSVQQKYELYRNDEGLKVFKLLCVKITMDVNVPELG